MLVFDKDGNYVEQWLAAVGGPQMSDVTGMVVVRPPGEPQRPLISTGSTPTGSIASPLVDIGDALQRDAGPNASPARARRAPPTKKPHEDRPSRRPDDGLAREAR